MMSAETRFKAVDAVLKLIELNQIHFSGEDKNPKEITKQFLDVVELVINRIETDPSYFTGSKLQNQGH